MLETLFTNMDMRKIQVTGGSSYMITLPKDWVEDNNLNKNDPVFLEKRNSGLYIHPGKEDNTVESLKNIEPIDDDSFLFRQLVGAYIAGHRIIKVSSQSEISGSSAAVISKFTQTAIGLEILEEDSHHILIKDLLSHKDMPQIRSLERMKVLVENMLGEILNCMKTGDLSRVTDIPNRDSEIDRINWLITRQTNIYLSDPDQTISTDSGMIISNVIVSRVIERIGDHAVNISKNLSLIKNNPDYKKELESLEPYMFEICNLYSMSIEGYFSNRIDLAEKSIVKTSNIVDNLKIEKHSIRDNVSSVDLATIIGSLRRISEYCTDISEQTINKEMRF